MINNKKVICVIPARLNSSRFPRKVLALIKGKSLLEWVWQAASKVALFDEIYIAVDSNETMQIAKGFGAKCLMTHVNCASGTDRLVQLHQEGRAHADIWVNWQADEPFINAEMIEDLLQSCDEDECDLWTLCKKIEKEEEIHSPHVVKVVYNHQKEALYFSRSTIPYYRMSNLYEGEKYYKHIGMYGFSSNALKKIATFSVCELEKAEQLEQLRFLHFGLKIKVHETSHEIFGIDIPEHLELATSLLI